TSAFSNLQPGAGWETAPRKRTNWSEADLYVGMGEKSPFVAELAKTTFATTDNPLSSNSSSGANASAPERRPPEMRSIPGKTITDYVLTKEDNALLKTFESQNLTGNNEAVSAILQICKGKLIHAPDLLISK